MKIFWRTLFLMVFLISVGTLGYFTYINMSGASNVSNESTEFHESHESNIATDQSLNQGQTQTTDHATLQQEIANPASAEKDGPPAPKPLIFETSGVLTLPASIAHHDWTKDLPVVVVVDKTNTETFVLQMFDGNSVYVVYQADNAIGKEESPTPPGPYTVASKTLQPTWTPPKSIDKDQETIEPYDQNKNNPLGVAAVHLNKWNIVLHGTNSPHSIGKEASHGCIRHRNEDILHIYDSVWKGTPVIVSDKLEGTKVSKEMFLPVKNTAG